MTEVRLTYQFRYEPRPTRMRRHAGPSAVSIATGIAEEYGLTFREISGRSQVRRIVDARQDVMHALYETGRYSLTEIGRLLNRDHSTVHHGVRAHEARVWGRE